MVYEPSVCERIQDSISAAQTMKLFTEALYKPIKYKALPGHEEKDEKNYETNHWLFFPQQTYTPI